MFTTAHDHALIGAASSIPLPSPGKPSEVLSIAPLTLRTPDRLTDLQLRISFPYSKDITSKLPILLLSHGHGPSSNLSSLHGYGPLSHFYASHGFAVIQPTHLSSRALPYLHDPNNKDAKDLFWSDRPLDLTRILDRLSDLEDAVPLIKGRLDAEKVAVLGHSMGAHTAMMTLGMTMNHPELSEKTIRKDPRIKAGIIVAGPGRGAQEDLTQTAYENYKFLRGPDFSTLTTRCLVCVSDTDESAHMTTRGPSWHVDSYTDAPGAEACLTIRNSGHGLGGISGWDAAEAREEEDVAKVEVLKRITVAYLRKVLDGDERSWEDALEKLKGVADLGNVEVMA